MFNFLESDNTITFYMISSVFFLGAFFTIKKNPLSLTSKVILALFILHSVFVALANISMANTILCSLLTITLVVIFLTSKRQRIQDAK
jgi:O-antigen ligase